MKRLKDLRGIVKHVRSVKGGLAVLTGLLILVAAITEGNVRQVLQTGALVLLCAVVFLISHRASALQARLHDLSHRGGPTGTNLSRRAKETQPGDQGCGPSRSTSVEVARAELRRHLHTRSARLGVLPRIHSTPRDGEIGTSDGGDQAPLVTVVVPCFNESDYLYETLESVSQQTFQDWECIVVDDASTDISVRQAWGFQRRDPRFRVVRHGINGGLSAARNTGLRLARGVLVTFLDSDDLLLTESLQDRLDVLTDWASNPNVAGSYCGVRLAPDDVCGVDLTSKESWGAQKILDFVSAGGECPFNVHAALTKTQLLQEIGGFDESIRGGAEDWDLWLRVLRNGYMFVPGKWRTAVYRQKRQSMVRSMADRHVREAQRLLEVAYRDAEADTLRLPSELPMDRSLPYYQKTISLAKRVVRFATLALLGGEEAAAEDILMTLPTECWPLVERHLRLDHEVREAVRRCYGLSAQEVQLLNKEIPPLVSILRDRIAQAARQDSDTATVVVAERPSIDILFVPVCAFHVYAMEKLHRQAADRGLTCGYLLVDRISGDQGVSAAVGEADTQRWSINEWFLGGWSARRFVLAYPWDRSVWEVIQAAGGTEDTCYALDDGKSIEDLLLPEVEHVRDVPRYGEEILLEVIVEDLHHETLVRHSTSPSKSAQPVVAWPDHQLVAQEYPEFAFDGKAMSDFRNRHVGERVVIIGNGPSLNQLELTRLRDECTIGVNGIFYAEEQMGFPLTYYVVEDTAVMRDNLPSIISYEAGHKFFPSIYRDLIGDLPNVTYFAMNRGFYDHEGPAYCVPRFSTDATQRVFAGQSVTIMNLQLAYYMGFTEVILIGMDFSYVIPSDAVVNGVLITSQGADPNHFHPDYFGEGKVWKDPKLDRVRVNYELTKRMYEGDGRKILNATPGGNLHVFPRADYNVLFPPRARGVS